MLRWRLADEEESEALFGDERWATRHVGTGEYRGFEFLHVNAKRIINRVRGAGAGLGFEFTVNPYRGCSHACTYCFARPTHQYLGLDMGRDFERRIVVKVNAVERLRAELASARWRGELIALGTNTDPYQLAEARYHLTRGIVRTLSAAANPFSILTKSTLVLRDLDLLAEAAARTTVRLDVSVGTLDLEVWRSTEPGTPPPARRLDAVRRLNEAGVPVRSPRGPGPPRSLGLAAPTAGRGRRGPGRRSGGGARRAAAPTTRGERALLFVAGRRSSRPRPPLRPAVRGWPLPASGRAGPDRPAAGCRQPGAPDRAAGPATSRPTCCGAGPAPAGPLTSRRRLLGDRLPIGTVRATQAVDPEGGDP